MIRITFVRRERKKIPKELLKELSQWTTIKQAEFVLNEIAVQIKESVTYDFELEYNDGFFSEKSTIEPNANVFLLEVIKENMAKLEEEAIEELGGHDFFTEMINDLERIYADSEVSTVTRSRQESKKVGVFGKLFRKNHDSNYTNDFQELEELEELEKFEREQLEKVEVAPAISTEEFGDIPPIQEVQEVERQGMGQVNVMPVMDDNSRFFANDPKGEFLAQGNQIFSFDSIDPVATESQVAYSREVAFPSLENHLDITELDSFLATFQKRFIFENLQKLVEVPDEEGEMAKKKQVFANKVLAGSGFTKLQEELGFVVDKAKERLKGELSAEWKRAVQAPYEEIATEQTEAKLEELRQEKEQEVTQEIEQLREAKEKQLAQFEREQQIAKDAFINEQEVTHAKFVAKAKEEIKREAAVRKEKMEADFKVEFEKEYEQSIYQTKEGVKQGIEENKIEALTAFRSSFAEQIKPIEDAIKEKLNHLQQQIKQNEDKWRQEIVEEKRLAMEKEKLDIESKKVETDKESLELERQRLAEEARMREEEKLEALTQEEVMKSLRAELEAVKDSVLSGHTKTEENIRAELEQEKKRKKSMWQGLTIGIAASLVIIIGGYLLLNNLGHAQVIPEPVATTEVDTSMLEAIKAIENRLDNMEISQVSGLANLLEKGNFDEAMETYDDLESAKVIARSLFDSRDIARLTVLNEEHDLPLGDLKLAVLRNEPTKARELWRSMSEEEKNQANGLRVLNLELSNMFFSNGENEVAEAILTRK